LWCGLAEKTLTKKKYGKGEGKNELFLAKREVALNTKRSRKNASTKKRSKIGD